MDNNTTPAKAGDSVHPPKPHVVHLTLSYRVLVVLAILLVVPWVLALVTVGLYTPLRSGGGDHASGAPANTTLAGGPRPGQPRALGRPGVHPDQHRATERVRRRRQLGLRALRVALPEHDARAGAGAPVGGGPDRRPAGRRCSGACKPSPEISGFIVRPSDETLKGLSADARGRLYRVPVAVAPEPGPGQRFPLLRQDAGGVGRQRRCWNPPPQTSSSRLSTATATTCSLPICRCWRRC